MTAASAAGEQGCDSTAGLMAALNRLNGLVEQGAATVPAEEAWRHYADTLAAVADCAGQEELLGLADVAVRLAERAADVDRGSPEADAVRMLLARFVAAARDHAANPADNAAQQALLTCLVEDLPGPALGDSELEIVRMMLDMAAEVPALAAAAPEGAGTPSSPVASFDTTPAAEQSVDAAVLAMFAEEAAEVLEGFARAVGLAAGAGEGERSAHLEGALGDLESLARGAEYSGLAALVRVLEWLHAALATNAHSAEFGTLAEVLQELPPALTGYLAHPTLVEAAAPLAILLQDPAWLDSAVTEDDAANLVLGLTAVTVTAPEERRDARPHQASPEDVSLDVPEDIDAELLEGLLLELPIQSAAFAQATQRIIAGRGTREDIEVAKRAAHTLKGAANTVGVRGLATLTHHLEDILVALSEHAVLPNLGLSQTLGYAADCLEGMSEALAGLGAAPPEAIEVLQDVLNWANRIDAEGIAIARGEAARDTPAEEDGAAPEGVAAPVIAGDRDQPTAMLRVPAHVVDELLRLVGEAMTSTAQIQNRLDLALQQARAISRQNVLLQQLVGQLEHAVDLRGIHAAGQANPAAPTSDFDALELEQYNELQTLSRRMIEVATDSREMGLSAEQHLTVLSEMVEQQGRLHLENQRAALATRMVPVSSVFSRLQRGVRQACRILDKEVALHLDGSETVMDGDVLHELVDALMHVLRNAVDHGIERAEDRMAAGKSASGNIYMSFQRQGEYIAVRCEDDGRGLDLEAIRAQAERRGVIAPGVTLSDNELTRLILIPGFSTRDGATQVSGRGIGLDAVNARVSALKGLLNLESRPGRGLTLEMRLPVTLLATHALLVRAGARELAISTRGLIDVRYLSTEELQQLGSTGGEAGSDVLELEQVLGLPAERTLQERAGWVVLIVRLESGGEQVVVVHEVLEGRNLVVKTLGRYVPKIPGIVGATILGDGNVAPVIDLPELLHSLGDGSRWSVGAELPESDEAGAQRRRQALVVDDSLSARRIAARVLSDAGYEVRTAVDGLDAVGMLEEGQPDIVITDLEMPRMNGFEFTQHLRARAQSRRLPVIMVTSRATEKHRHQAGLAGVTAYLTKPFDERELVDVVESLIAQPA